jgi:hypothetical protein
VLFIGDDWAEAHHDIEVEDESGRVLARRRVPEGLAGITTLHELVAEHLDPTAEPDQVQVGIETDRGPWVQALLAAGYVVFAINPLQVARYRERHSPSGAKSDAADAHLLAEIIRLDRAHHRRIAGDSEIAEHSQDRRPGASDDDLVAGAAGEHAAVVAAGVLPGRLGRVRHRPSGPGRAGGAHRGAQPGAGPAAVPIAYRNPAAACRPATQRLGNRRHDPDCVEI